MRILASTVVLLTFFGASFVHQGWTWADDVWQTFETGTQSSLRGLAAVNHDVAWACGSKATLIQTVDGGKNWRPHLIPHLQDVEIRSIHAWDSDQAIVATAGQPALILKTIDRGATWKTTYENKSPQAFFDGMKFWNENSGIAFSDPIDGALLIVTTDNGGDSWNAIDPKMIPKMESGEAGFAASNSSLCTLGNQFAWIGLGGGSDGPSRVFRSRDGGSQWTAHMVPTIARGVSSGIFSIAFENENKGIAVGGDYNKLTQDTQNIAISNDGGLTWRAPNTNRPFGFRSSIVAIPSKVAQGPKFNWIACGPSGCDTSSDGEKWSSFSKTGFHAMVIATDYSVWAAGSSGRVARLK